MSAYLILVTRVTFCYLLSILDIDVSILNQNRKPLIN